MNEARESADSRAAIEDATTGATERLVLQPENVTIGLAKRALILGFPLLSLAGREDDPTGY